MKARDRILVNLFFLLTVHKSSFEKLQLITRSCSEKDGSMDFDRSAQNITAKIRHFAARLFFCTELSYRPHVMWHPNFDACNNIAGCWQVERESPELRLTHMPLDGPPK